MKLKKTYIIIWFIIFTFSLLSQKAVRISGIVVDKETGKSLIGANLYFEGTSIYTSTDNEGYFQLLRISPGIYSLKVDMVGYYAYTQVLKINEYDNNHLIIKLKPELYFLPVQIVEAEKPDLEIKNGQIVHTYFIDSTKHYSNNLHELLKTIPGITVVKNSNGKTRIQTSGSESKHVKILLDGVDVTNPQTGEVLLDIVPLDNISKIEVVSSGGAAKYGSGAVGGVINIITKNIKNNNLSFYSTFTEYENNRYGNGIETGKLVIGNVDAYKYGISTGLNISSILFWNNSFSFTSAHNKFGYTHEGENLVRLDNDFIKRRYFSKISISDTIKKLKKLSFQLNYNNDFNQLPSPYFENEPSLGSYSKEKFLIISNLINLKLFPGIGFQSINSWKRIINYLNGEKRPRYVAFKSNNINEVFETNNSINTSFWQNKYFIELDFSYQKEKLNMKDLLNPERSMGKHQREMLAFTLQNSFNYQYKMWGIDLSYLQRFDKYYNDKWLGFPSVSGGIKYLHPWYVVRAVGQYNKGFRYPDLNSLFWFPYARAQGNPDLKPEKSENRKAGIIIDIVSLKTNIQYFFYNNAVNDYIIWLDRIQGWTPVNLMETKITGYEISLKIEPFPFMKLQADYYNQNPLNKTKDKTQVNYYNKQLPFLFTYQFKGNLQVNYHRFYVTVFYQNNSLRKSNDYNTTTNDISKFNVWDFNIGRSIKIYSSKINISLEIDNLFNEGYQLLNGYPMPGRHYKLNIHYSIN